MKRDHQSLVSTRLFEPILVVMLAGLLFVIPQTTSTQQAVNHPTSFLAPCEIRGIKGTGQCGKYEVFEDRVTKSGRRISVNVVVLPATGSTRESDPFVYIAGGPGSSAVEDASYIAEEFAQLRDKRDLLFVDQRGTGESNPLNCNLFNPADPQSYFGYYFPLDPLRKCRQELEAKADLTLYTTAVAMDDLDEIRAVLGYDRLNLFGASYGTRAALTYLKRHPQHVRTVMLQGVSPTNHHMPYDFPKQTERALQGVLAECAADETCNKAFPNVRDDEKAALNQLLKGPVEVEVRTEGGKGREKVRLSRDLAAEAIRYMLYNSGSAQQVPLFLHLAAGGNFVPLAQAALKYRQNIVATGSNGLYLSITCAEDVPWIKPGEGERLAQDTFLGDYRLRQQREACALWPRAQIESDYGEPVRSALPVLIFTGEWDPVTPPSNGDTAAGYLSSSLHVIVPHGGHGFDGLEGLECISRLSVRFVETGAVKGLDTSCVKAIKRSGFRTKM
jgi:pimeloyl-ACP methyl ester carboxylesterase